MTVNDGQQEAGPFLTAERGNVARLHDSGVVPRPLNAGVPGGPLRSRVPNTQ